MLAFADRTGLTSPRPQRRYLWTDAFAVCNFLGLAHATGESRYVALARRLVDAVHGTLGRYRADDQRKGWLSGLSEIEGTRHPTRGGLRIGKPLPERPLGTPLDPDLEWDRDGQYFHYLTKWMHALDQLARFSSEPRFNLWARELAQSAHDAFVHGPAMPGHGLHMYWKMSVDLSRPLVSSMGHHDPVDGLVTAYELAQSKQYWPGAQAGPGLERAERDFASMTHLQSLATDDPLGLGGLLFDALRVQQLIRAGDGQSAPLLRGLLAAVIPGLQHYLARADLGARPEFRLAFRELGLAIGLEGLGLFSADHDDPQLRRALVTLAPYTHLGDRVTDFWLDPEHQHGQTWLGHQDINEVMLATALAPRGFLLLFEPSGGGSNAGQSANNKE